MAQVKKWKFKKSFLSSGLVPCPAGSACILSLCQIFDLIVRISNFLLQYVAFPLAALVLMYGGIMWIISQGDENKIAQGKRAIRSAVLGLIFAFAAWIIVNELIHVLAGGFVWPGGANWQQIPVCNLRI